MDEQDHIKYTGVSNKTILENLVFLASEEKQVIVRIPIIPGITDTKKNIREIKEFLSHLTKHDSPAPSFKISLLPYHSIGKNKYIRFNLENKTGHLKEMTKEAIVPLKKEFEAEGFVVKIGG